MIPAIIRKMWEAKNTGSSVTFWGDGSPLREFTFSSDIAKALIFVLENYSGSEPINIGSTEETSISNVVKAVSRLLDYRSNITWDASMPLGQYKKPSSNSKFLSIGWKKEHYTSLEDGLEKTIKWFSESYPKVRGV